MSAERIEAIARVLCEEGVPLIRAEFGIDSCIASTRIALDVLEACRIEARPLAVDVIVINEIYRRGIDAGMDLNDRSTWPDGAWSVGLGFRRDESPSGHLVAAAAGRWLFDLTLDQAARPQHGIELAPLVLEPRAAFWKGEGSSLQFGSALASYRISERRERWWADSPNSGRRDAPVRKRIAGSILRCLAPDIRLKLADGTMIDFEAESALSAARRYVDAHQEAKVIAIREKPYGVFVLGRHQRIIG